METDLLWSWPAPNPGTPLERHTDSTGSREATSQESCQAAAITLRSLVAVGAHCPLSGISGDAELLSAKGLLRDRNLTGRHGALQGLYIKD